MKVTLKYFGAVAERTNKETELLELENELSSEDLKNLLELKYGLNNVQYSLAINKDIKSSFALSDNDEVALLPPFAGG